MTDFVLLCAVPGAGKTYFGKVAEESGEYKLVSSDDIREALWGRCKHTEESKESLFRNGGPHYCELTGRL